MVSSSIVPVGLLLPNTTIYGRLNLCFSINLPVYWAKLGLAWLPLWLGRVSFWCEQHPHLLDFVLCSDLLLHIHLYHVVPIKRLLLKVA